MTDVLSEHEAWTHGQRPALPGELDDEQRELIRRFFIDHPDGGYKQAARAAGIHATQAEAKSLIGGDDELRQFRLATLGLDEVSLFARLGAMAQDTEHRDQYRAVTFGLTALHGYGAQRVEHTGAGGGPMEVTNPDVTDALDRFTTTIRRLAERAEPSGAVRQAEPGRAALPPGEPRS